GNKPTQRSIAAHFKWSSNNAAPYYLDVLEKKGLLKVISNRKHDVHVPSTIRLLKSGNTAATAKPVPKVKERRMVLTGRALELGPAKPTPERLNRAACVLFSVA